MQDHFTSALHTQSLRELSLQESELVGGGIPGLSSHCWSDVKSFWHKDVESLNGPKVANAFKSGETYGKDDKVPFMSTATGVIGAAWEVGKEEGWIHPRAA